MRISFLILSFTSLLFFIHCSDNAEDPGIDCNQSDLSLSVNDVLAPACNVTGSFVLSGSGGSTPYSYSIDGVNFQASGSFTELAAGDYTLSILDANDCLKEVPFTLESSANGITINTVTTNSDCLADTGEITVEASGGDGTFTYLIGTNTVGQSTNTFDALAAGSYVIIVVDGSGCSSSKTVVIGTNVSLTGDIMPILQANCLQTSSGGGGCHNGDNGADRNWTNKSNVIAKASQIKSRTQSGDMPQAGSGQSLSQTEIALIACWVDGGALDN